MGFNQQKYSLNQPVTRTRNMILPTGVNKHGSLHFNRRIIELNGGFSRIAIFKYGTKGNELLHQKRWNDVLLVKEMWCDYI